METKLDAEAYRAIAMKIENDLQELIEYSERVEEVSVPVVGNLYVFPRLSPEIRTLEQQISLAQEKANEAIAILNTLAELKDAKKRGNDVIARAPALLITQMESQVESFIKLYDTKNDTKPNDLKKQQKQGKENNKSEQ